MSLTSPVREIAFSPVDVDLWIEEFLTVCGEGRALIVGPHAAPMVDRLLRRGIDCWGIDTRSGAVRHGDGGRCVPGGYLDLPVEHGPYRSMFLVGGSKELDGALSEARLNELGSSLRGSLYVRVFGCPTDGRDRGWWERRILANGYRKHPRRSLVQPYASLEQADPLVMYFETDRPEGEGTAHDADPGRNAGCSADAVLARYELGARLIRPWDSVLDLACGCGGGTHAMRCLTRGEKYLGVDADADLIAYARTHFVAGNLEFRQMDPADALGQLPEHSVDFAICAVPLPELQTVDGLLCGMERVVAPGGRLIVTISPMALAGANRGLLERFRQGYILEAVYRQHGDDVLLTSRALEQVPVRELLEEYADAWVVVLMRDPLIGASVPYRETAFRHVAQLPKHSVLNFAEYYQNPWIMHSLMHPGMRLNAAEDLGRAAARISESSAAESADAGAALCLLIYRVMEGALPEGTSAEEILGRSEQYLALAEPNPLQYRWQISIAFALGQLAMKRGLFDEARRRFVAVAGMDAFRWGPALATKTSEAMFLLGWLAWCAEDLAESRRWWQRGVDFGRQLLGRPLDETLLNPEFPNLFDYGDGMRELIYTLEIIARCTNGLHGLKLREAGIAFSADLIFNTFRVQRDQRDCHLRAAQQCVATLSRQIDGVREELRERTRELDQLRASTARPVAAPWASLPTFSQ